MHLHVFLGCGVQYLHKCRRLKLNFIENITDDCIKSLTNCIVERKLHSYDSFFMKCAGCFMPTWSEISETTWRRIRTIPFNPSFPDNVEETEPEKVGMANYLATSSTHLTISSNLVCQIGTLIDLDGSRVEIRSDPNKIVTVPKNFMSKKTTKICDKSKFPSSKSIIRFNRSVNKSKKNKFFYKH